MTKEETLWSFPQGESEPYGHAPINRIYEAMDEYAKQESIAFAEWVNRMDIHMVNAGYWQKNNPAFQEKHFAENSAELYTLYLKSKTEKP